MQIKVILDNSVSIEGERSDVEGILEMIENAEIEISTDFTGPEDSEDSDEGEGGSEDIWHSEAQHYSRTKQRWMKIGDMASPHIFNSIYRTTSLTRDEIKELYESPDVRRLLAELLYRAENGHLDL